MVYDYTTKARAGRVSALEALESQRSHAPDNRSLSRRKVGMPVLHFRSSRSEPGLGDVI